MAKEKKAQQYNQLMFEYTKKQNQNSKAIGSGFPKATGQGGVAGL